MNNYINNNSRLYIEQRNYLSGPLVYRILFPTAIIVEPDEAALKRVASSENI